MFESTGRSAITAVVITELFSESGCETEPGALDPGPPPVDEEEDPGPPEDESPPPVTGLSPRIHTRCCSVWQGGRRAYASFG